MLFTEAIKIDLVLANIGNFVIGRANSSLHGPVLFAHCNFNKFSFSFCNYWQRNRFSSNRLIPVTLSIMLSIFLNYRQVTVTMLIAILSLKWKYNWSVNNMFVIYVVHTLLDLDLSRRPSLSDFCPIDSQSITTTLQLTSYKSVI